MREGELGADGFREALDETRRRAGPVGPRRAKELIRSCEIKGGEWVDERAKVGVYSSAMVGY